MKHFLLFISLGMLLCSCQNSEKERSMSDTLVSDTVSENKDTIVEAVTSATAVKNKRVFNGVLVVAPQDLASVSLPMSGRVRDIFVMPGEFIKKGDVIANIENTDFIILQQNYLETKSQYIYLKMEYLRQKTLSAHNASSDKTFQLCESEYMSTKSRLDSYAAQLAIMNVDTACLISSGISTFFCVKAPMSGRVVDVKANIGKFISESESLCEIIRFSSPMIKITAYENDLSEIRVGDTVNFKANGIEDKIYCAVISSIAGNVNQVSRSIDIYADIISFDPRFVNGMYISASKK